MVGLDGGAEQLTSRNLEPILPKIWDRALVSIYQTKTSLDNAKFKDSWTMWAMERSDAIDDLAIVASQRCSDTISLTLAICEDWAIAWTCCSLGGSPAQQSIFTLLVELGTPAIPPKLRGKSNGRAIGHKCNPRTRYPVAKKTYSQPKKSQQTA